MNYWEQLISKNNVPYVIAEVAANHNGDMNIAKQLIIQAKDAGCHCVKFQSWTKESLFTKKMYQDPSIGRSFDQYSMSEEKLIQMKVYCDELKIDFACTPFSKKEADFLTDHLHVHFIKLSSTEVNNYDFLTYVGKKGLPIILSTGLSTFAEIEKAVHAIEDTGNKDIAILHCVSLYPPLDELVNLHNLDMLRQFFSYPIGFSDHTIGTAIPLAAVAKGAKIIEKHFTLGKNMPGWDHKVSANFEEMKQIVTQSERISKALGSFQRVLSDEERHNRALFRRSIVAARDIAFGKIIEYADLDTKRPGTGLHPEYMELIVGKTAKRSIAYDELIQKEDF